KMGTMVLAPGSYLVTSLTYDMELTHNMVGSIELSFYLDPDTWELTLPEEVRVTYLPDGVGTDRVYVLTAGGLTLDPVLVLDDATCRISGAITGQVSLQTEYEPEHNPDDYFDIDATFEFQRVVDYATMLGGQ